MDAKVSSGIVAKGRRACLLVLSLVALSASLHSAALLSVPFLWLSVANAEALERDPRSGSLSLISSSKPLYRRLEGSSGAAISARSFLLGNVRLVVHKTSERAPQQFTDIRGNLVPDKISKQSLFRGFALVRTRGALGYPRTESRKRIPIAGTLVPLRESSLLRFRIRSPASVNSEGRGRAWRIHQFEAVIPNSSGAVARNARVRSVSSRALGNRLCAAAPLSTLSSSPALRPQTAPFQTAPLQTARLETTATTRALELITDCDAECSQELGASGANDKIAEYINDVNTIYPEELGITVVLIKQVRRTSSSTYPASLTDSLSLLERFRTVGAALGNADAKHLITGKSLDSDVLGLAYVEATCSTPEFTAYGLSTRSSGLLTPIIIAHEIGHNLGASHDTVTGGIMSPRLGSPPPSSFSTFSRNEIAAYLQQFSPSCLEEKLPETSFTVSYKRRKLVASLSLPEGYAGCTVSFKAGITKSRQKTLLLQQVLEEGETNIPLLITNLSRVNPSGSSDIQVFLLPSATCTTGGDLSGPLRALTVSSTRSSPSGLGAAKGWMRALRNRLQE